MNEREFSSKGSLGDISIPVRGSSDLACSILYIEIPFERLPC